MAKIKILNDPLYGLISFPYEIVYDLIDHPYFQRLRRISQLGLSSYVYPGATHTRFHHAIGATHLCDRLIHNLIQKSIDISREEHEACLIATLLHDIGHGPYSHALERQLIDLHHEEITVLVMGLLNDHFQGRLDLAIQIFRGSYAKPFLHQIISSQLDVDRMDYLNRDSFYTGVAEGIIGYDRILKMMNVHDNDLVVEEKGIHSVEKFLVSRHLMYHQVYLHKTSIAVEQMLKSFVRAFKQQSPSIPTNNKNLDILINPHASQSDAERLSAFLKLDDYDIFQLIKSQTASISPVLKMLAAGIVDRHLFKTKVSEVPFETYYKNELFVKSADLFALTQRDCENIVIFGTEENSLYKEHDEIQIMTKHKGQKVTLSDMTRLRYSKVSETNYFVVYPKALDRHIILPSRAQEIKK